MKKRVVIGVIGVCWLMWSGAAGAAEVTGDSDGRLLPSAVFVDSAPLPVQVLLPAAEPAVNTDVPDTTTSSPTVSSVPVIPEPAPAPSSAPTVSSPVTAVAVPNIPNEPKSEVNVPNLPTALSTGQAIPVVSSSVGNPSTLRKSSTASSGVLSPLRSNRKGDDETGVGVGVEASDLQRAKEQVPVLEMSSKAKTRDASLAVTSDSHSQVSSTDTQDADIPAKTSKPDYKNASLPPKRLSVATESVSEIVSKELRYLQRQ